MVEVNKNLTKIETGFNIAGSIPIVGALSGAVRLVAAKIQFFIGGIIGVIGLIGQMVDKGAKKWEDLAHLGLDHIIHAVLNTLRALGEILASVTIVGSLALLSYQIVCPNKFAPIIKYDEPVPV